MLLLLLAVVVVAVVVGIRPVSVSRSKMQVLRGARAPSDGPEKKKGIDGCSVVLGSIEDLRVLADA